MAHDTQNNGYMTISEMAQEFDVTLRTLRFYEAQELLSPVRENSRRLFSRRDRARLKLILKGKRFGFTLEEIRRLLALYEEGKDVQLSHALQAARRRHADLVARREELDGAIRDLESDLAWGRAELAKLRRSAA